MRAQSPCRRTYPVVSSWLAAAFVTAITVAQAASFRPPSVPLVACDPYFSIWSPADKLTDADTVHWTGKRHRLTALLRIDGKPFRLLGKEPVEVPALDQTNLEVTPTTTTCTFEGVGVEVILAFVNPRLPEDLDLVSGPFTYLTCRMRARDGREHQASFYLDAAAELAVNDPTQQVTWSSERISNVQGAKEFRAIQRQTTVIRALAGEILIRDLSVLKIGSVDQPVLAKKGDDLRIDWGYFYVAAPAVYGTHQAIGAAKTCRESFLANGQISERIDSRQPRAANDDSPVAATTFEFRNSQIKNAAPKFLILAYDDLYSIQYFKQNLRPYWRRNGWQAPDLLKAAAKGADRILARCAEFDRNLTSALHRAGGDQYARICSLAYIQCIAANKIVADANGLPLMFPKENFSNGCIGTVDVLYPMAPQFLFLGPSLAKAMLVPILDYAASSRWRWPFAPHDLGTYPLANGQVYGGGERTQENQMPVEETGNMLLLLAALAQVEGNADFCARYWPVLEKWADYLKAKGFDPENQLCTDDFAGHLAHNVNLSAKAICALGAFGRLCALRGDPARATELASLTKEFAARWVKEADDGDHFRLAFDRPGTWSQKYNMVWDCILGLDLFSAEVLRKEMRFYKGVQNPFGLPLDSRKDYTKLDWTLWTATLTQERADFEAIVDPVYRFLNETPNRVPMTDWYDTKTAKRVGFQARSVVGGVFLKMLFDLPNWKSWASRDTAKPANWAPFPKPPRTVTSVPTSEREGMSWRYTTEQPADGWFHLQFDDSAWKTGPGGFGTEGTPGATVRTGWKTTDIWLRRHIDISDPDKKDLQLRIHHDEDAEVYLNGILAARLSGYTVEYETVPIFAKARAGLKPGANLIAVRCHQTAGGQYIDVGLDERVGP
jgi:hypothetical protein